MIDLFAGCGGLTLGVHEAARMLGLEVDIRLICEQDPMVRGVFCDNFAVDDRLVGGDVVDCFDRACGRAVSSRERATRFRVGRNVDLLVGGPPCQGHSTLNNHTRGNDPKNALYLRMVRAAEVILPSAILIENVPAIERDSQGLVSRAWEKLERLGYLVSASVVSVAELGVPQLRRRHVLTAVAGSKFSLQEAIDAGRVDTQRDLEWAIGDLRSRPGSLFDDAGALTRENLRRANYLLQHDLYDLPNRLRPPCQRGNHKYKSMYGRLNWREAAQTITTGFGSPGQGRYLHPSEPRTLTPHEAARIQFFPDWFDFGRITQRRRLARAIGNAVPPKLAFVLTRQILAAIRGESKSSRRIAAPRMSIGA